MMIVFESTALVARKRLSADLCAQYYDIDDKIIRRAGGNR